MFVNDMTDVLKSSSLAMYADDSKSYKTIKTMCDVRDLQADLNLLCVLSASNELHFQPKNVIIQGPMSRSMQLNYTPVTAFSQTDLFLDLIYFE